MPGLALVQASEKRFAGAHHRESGGTRAPSTGGAQPHSDSSAASSWAVAVEVKSQNVQRTRPTVAVVVAVLLLLLLLALLAEPPPAHTSASLSLTSASTTDATIGCVLIATASRRSDVSFMEGGSVCSSIASLESAAAAAAASSRAAVLWARLMAEISSVPFMR